MKKLLEAMDSMAKAEKKPTGPKFPGYWKGTDPADKSRSKMVGSAQESIIKELDKAAKDTATERKLKEDFANFNDVTEGVVGRTIAKGKDWLDKVDGNPNSNNLANYKRQEKLNKTKQQNKNQRNAQQGVAEGVNVDSQIKRIKDRILQLKDWNTAGTHDKKIKELQAKLKELQSQKQGVVEGSGGVDTVSVDVPLLIRLLEYAREDAKTDMDLHDVAERLIKLSQAGRTLTMHDYDNICPTEQVDEVAPVPPVAPGGNAQDPNNQATNADKQATVNTQKNLSKLKTVDPTLNPGLANQALQGLEANPNKAVSGAQLQQTQNLADLVGDALADPQKGSQLATIIQQVQQAKKVQ